MIHPRTSLTEIHQAKQSFTRCVRAFGKEAEAPTLRAARWRMTHFLQHARAMLTNASEPDAMRKALNTISPYSTLIETSIPWFDIWNCALFCKDPFQNNARL